MSDHFDRLTIVLEEDMRDEDAEGIIAAILHIRGVAEVLPHVVSSNDMIERSRARVHLLRKIVALFQNEEER